MTPEEVRAATFRESLRGYSPGAVDRLLERIATQIEVGQAIHGTIEAGTPLPRTLRDYSVDDVDNFLAALGGTTQLIGGSTTVTGGRHFKTTHTGIPPDEVADVWLRTDNHHILQVRVRARGVLRIMGYGDPREWLVWPFTWLIHAALYRGQWAVEIHERRVRGRIIMADGRVVYSVTFPSRSKAREAKNELSRRIEQIADTSS